MTAFAAANFAAAAHRRATIVIVNVVVSRRARIGPSGWLGEPPRI
jgi:hypothetical protein